MGVQITIFDHRGCARAPKEYKGELSQSQDDEMMVKVAQTQLKVESPAFKELANKVLLVSLSLAVDVGGWGSMMIVWSENTRAGKERCVIQGREGRVMTGGQYPVVSLVFDLLGNLVGVVGGETTKQAAPYNARRVCVERWRIHSHVNAHACSARSWIC